MKAASLIALGAIALGTGLIVPVQVSAASFGAAAGLGKIVTPSFQLTACSASIDSGRQIWLAAACGDGGGTGTGTGSSGTNGPGDPDPTGGTGKPRPNVRHKFD